jgi:uncharacterized protein DUF4123/FHA domain-containing protein
MYPFLMVLTGLYTGRKIALSGDRATTIGRGEGNHYSLFPDGFVSTRHAEIAVADGACEVRDLDSSNGVFINDRRIERKALLQEGDHLRIGETMFTLSKLSVPIEILLDAGELEGKQQEFLASLEKEPGLLYAILDAAQGPRIRDMLCDSHTHYHSLYEGKEGEELADIAPFLVSLPIGSPLTATIIREGWNKNWGVFLTTEIGFLELRRHLRHFLKVQTEDGKELLFRFYDPRVLSEVLPHFETAQREEFYGPIAAYYSQTNDEWTAHERPARVESAAPAEIRFPTQPFPGYRD